MSKTMICLHLVKLVLVALIAYLLTTLLISAAIAWSAPPVDEGRSEYIVSA